MVMQSLTILRLAAAGLATAGVLLLAGCGGGGGPAPVEPKAASSSFPASSSLANICTLEGEKQFVRSYLDEAYLWFDEIPPVDPAAYNSVQAYFNALLVKTPDASGRPRDRFSTLDTSPPGPPPLAGLAALPLRADTGSASQPVPLNHSVPLATVVRSPAGRAVGYIQFNNQDLGAQDALISAFQQMRDATVQDLVLDMRFNPGGFLYIAQTAASMITGPENNGRIFEQLRYSAKRAAETAASTFVFSSLVQTPETAYPRGTPLPQLDLPRVYILTSGLTCSASESVINSLRGIGVDVILIGATTCGKPYGFERKDNCGASIFAIEFQGFNAKGFGDYTAGFTPNCPVPDNFTGTMGVPDEPLLAAALRHIDTGSCPVTSPRALHQIPGVASPDGGAVPPWGGRLLRPQP